MSTKPPGDKAKGYCSPEHIADFFDKFDEFSESTDPTRQQVQARIRAESNWIDNYTGHAFRARKKEEEYHSLDNNYYISSGNPIHLQQRDIRTPLDPSKGDKVEFWDGDEWEEWVSDPEKDEGRDGDYWVNATDGILYVRRRATFFSRHSEVRITYRFGKKKVPQIVRDACARRVAAHYLESQQYRITTPGNEEGPDPQVVAENWREQSESDLDTYVEVRSTGL